jgi:hypothetical protein
MKKSLFASILMVLIGGSFASSVIADDTLVRFKGAIGDIPVANVAGTPNPDGSFPDVIRNIVRGVNPAGQIWVISDFRADVKVDGRIRGRRPRLAVGRRQCHWHERQRQRLRDTDL